MADNEHLHVKCSPFPASMDQKLCKNFIHGGGGGWAGIKQIVFLFPRFTPKYGFLFGISTIYASIPLDPTLNVAPPKFYFRWLRASQISNTHRSTSMQVVARGSLLYGGGCTTNGEHWTPLPSLLSRLVKNRQWQIMNIYM